MAYCPPSDTLELNQALITYITSFCNGKEVIVMRDFNLPPLRVDEDSFRASLHNISILDCFSSLALTQWIKEPTFITLGNTLESIPCFNQWKVFAKAFDTVSHNILFTKLQYSGIPGNFFYHPDTNFLTAELYLLL